MKATFNIESDGLLVNATRLWNLVIRDYQTKEVFTFEEQDIVEGSKRLQTYDILIGHNITGFDMHMLNKFCNFGYVLESKIELQDTLILSRMLNPHVIGHSLLDWAKRLKLDKFKQVDFSKNSPELLQHGIQNTVAAEKLYDFLSQQQTPFEPKIKEAIKLYTDYAYLMGKQQEAGILVDKEKLLLVAAEIEADQDALRPKLIALMPKIKCIPSCYTEARLTGRLLSETATEFTYIQAKSQKLVKKQFMFEEPNPNSAKQVKSLLLKLGWKPSKFSEKTGEPSLDKDIIDFINIPVARTLSEYRKGVKKLGFIKIGEKSWLNSIAKDGNIHGSVNVHGAATGRCTANNPNTQQVPKDKVDSRFREIWIARPGKVLVGADASQLELRIQSHYLFPYDNGKYASLIESGTDMHTFHKELLELNDRGSAKGIKYGFDYGAGAAKLGLLHCRDQNIEVLDEEELKHIGYKVKEHLETRITGLGQMLKALKDSYKQKKFVWSLAGRPLKLYSIDVLYAVYNYLIQGGAADLMAKTCVIFYHKMLDKTYKLGVHYNYVLNIHDEIVVECDSNIASDVKEILEQSWRGAGEHFKMKCSIEGEARVGSNWAETKGE